MIAVVTITLFAGWVRVGGADRIEFFAATKQELAFCDQGDGRAPCLTTQSGYTEWRGTLAGVGCGESVMVPVGAYRVEAYRGCDGTAGANWNVPAVRTIGGTADFDGDGDSGTDADIEAFFACLGGNCCGTCGSADFDHDGDTGTDGDIEAFYAAMGK